MRFDHVGILVEDLDAACAFAREVVQLGEPVDDVDAEAERLPKPATAGGWMLQITEAP